MSAPAWSLMSVAPVMPGRPADTDERAVEAQQLLHGLTGAKHFSSRKMVSETINIARMGLPLQAAAESALTPFGMSWPNVGTGPYGRHTSGLQRQWPPTVTTAERQNRCS